MFESLKRISKKNTRAIAVCLALAALCSVIVTALHLSHKRQKKAEYRITELKIDSLLSASTAVDTSHMASLERIELAKAMLANKEYPSLMGKICLKEAAMARARHQYPQSIECYKQAIAFFEKSGDEKQLARIYYNLGSNYKKTGDFNQSFDASLRALSLYMDLADQQGLRRCYSNIGSIYKYLQQYDKALYYYQLALAISKELNYQEGESSALNNIGTIYSQMDKKELALEFYEKSYALKKSKSPLESAIYYGNISGSLLALGRTQEAFAALKKAEYSLSQTFEPRNKISNLLDFGDYYLHLSQNDSALGSYSKALKLAKTYQLNERLLSCHEGMMKAYQALNQFDLAFEHQTHYLNLKERLFNTSKSIEIAQMDADFKNSHFKTQQANERDRFFLLSIILLLGLLSLGLIILNIRHKQKHIREEFQIKQQLLEKQKSRIEKNLDDKNRELALYSMQLSQQQQIKNALVARIRQKMENKSTAVKSELYAIIGEMERESNQGAIWTEMEHRFVAVHPGFYEKLSSDYPNLTLNEKRLCTFLKLNMTTKEIASITGQTPHSINIARTRLRKKLGLTQNEITTDQFLNSI